jgi:hypothetical protein
MPRIATNLNSVAVAFRGLGRAPPMPTRAPPGPGQRPRFHGRDHPKSAEARVNLQFAPRLRSAGAWSWRLAAGQLGGRRTLASVPASAATALSVADQANHRVRRPRALTAPGWLGLVAITAAVLTISRV